MSVRDAVVDRFIEICKQKNIKPNMLPNLSGILYDRRNATIVTIKKLCDGLDMTLSEFFSAPEFDNLEQEIE